MTEHQKRQIATLGGLILTINSDSMFPNIPIGTLAFAKPLEVIGAAPEYGDIIIFGHVGEYSNSLWIKRVVGKGGDEIRMEGGRVFRNGIPLDRHVDATKILGRNSAASCFRESNGNRSYRICQADGESGFWSNTKPMIVPNGSLFVMGDSRDDSLDSRSAKFGFVQEANVVGRVTRVAREGVDVPFE